MRADVNDRLDLLALALLVEFELGHKIKVVRRGVNGIAPQDQEGIDLVRVDIRAKLAEGFQVIYRMRFDGIGVIQRGAHIAELCVDGMRERVNFRGLLLSGNHQ